MKHSVIFNLIPTTPPTYIAQCPDLPTLYWVKGKTKADVARRMDDMLDIWDNANAF